MRQLQTAAPRSFLQQTLFYLILSFMLACGYHPRSNPLPSITGISPSSATFGAPAPVVTMSGSGFLSSSTVTYNGTSHPATFVSASQLSIQLSTGDLAAAGTFPVVVTNPTLGGGSSNSATFTVNNPTPSITLLSPISVALAAGAQALTINGSGFVSSSSVTYNGTSHPATFVSASQLTIQLSTGDLAVAGTFPVVITNATPGGGSSNSATFTVNNPTPSIASLSPTSVILAAAGQAVTINGSGFTQSSTVTYNGTARVFTLGNSNQITLQLTATDLGVSGAFPVVVTNPTPGGGSSPPVTFEISGLIGHVYQGNLPNGMEVVVTIDPTSGNTTNVGTVPNSTSIGVIQGSAALDVVNHRYFFIEVTGSGSAILHGSDTHTGAEIVRVTLPLNPSAIVFDSSAGGLLGHAYQGSFPNGNEVLVRIDTASGNFTTVGTVPNSGSMFVAQGVATLDVVKHRYFFIEVTPTPSAILHVIDTQTGAEISQVTLPPNPPAIVFDPSAGGLLGHTYQGTFPNGNEVLVRIDTASGNFTTVGTVPNSGSMFVAQGVATLDVVKHRYFFIEVTPTPSAILHVIDTQTGTEAGKFALPNPLTPSALAAPVR
jgi:hypothetical protein